MGSSESQALSEAIKSGQHSGLKERLRKGWPDSLPFARNLDEAKLVAHLSEKGIAIDRDSFTEWSAGLGSAEELVSFLLAQDVLKADLGDAEVEWVWAIVIALWEKWFPDPLPFENIDKGIISGYDREDPADRCRDWLEVWLAFLRLADRAGAKTVEEVDKRFWSSVFLENWVQDLEIELADVARFNRDQAWHRRRVDYCEEFLERFPKEDEPLIQNIRRAWAESLFAVGETERAEEHFRKWLSADPHWTWGWVAWADCYFFDWGEAKDLNRAEELLKKGLSVPGIREQNLFYERLTDLYEELGRPKEAGEMRAAIKRLHAPTPKRTGSKIGRNDPCPCGSGKKFKKCCGG